MPTELSRTYPDVEESKRHFKRLRDAIADIGATSQWAQDTRVLAGMTHNPSAKRLLLEVADIQDRIAAGAHLPPG